MADRVPSPSTQPFTVTRLASALGAEVRGLDLGDATTETAEKIDTLLAEHLVPAVASTGNCTTTFARTVRAP